MTAKKSTLDLHGFHFPSDGLHFAEYIEAENIETATAQYHKTKRLINTPPVPKEPEQTGV